MAKTFFDHAISPSTFQRVGIVFRRRWPIAIGVAAAYLAITAFCLFNAWLNLLFLLGGLAPLTGSAIAAMRSVLCGEALTWKSATAGFRRIDAYVGAFWCLVLSSVLPLMPLAVGGFVAAALRDSEGSPEAIRRALLVGGLVSLAPLAWTLTRYGFVLAIVSQPDWTGTTSEAFERSAQLVTGRSVAVFASLTLLAVVAVAGAAAFGIGVLATLPLAATLYLAYYEQLAANPLPVDAR